MSALHDRVAAIRKIRDLCNAFLDAPLRDDVSELVMHDMIDETLIEIAHISRDNMDDFDIQLIERSR